MNILVFDTETAGMTTQTLLNVGYKIIDLNIQKGNYNTLIERDYLIGEVYNNELFMLNDAFVGAEKYEKYRQLLAQKKTIKRTPKQIFTTMVNDIEKYKVLFGYAFNCDFDIDKFAKTASKFEIENPLERIPVFDIWAYAINYICKTEDYIKWAKDNEMFTKSQQYISTSVETVTRYLLNDITFEEQHTALDDVQHETDILIECVRKGCDITRGMKLNGRFIPSEKKLTKTIVYNGETFEFEYTKEFERNGIIKLS